MERFTDESGFTLVELLAVVVVLGLLAALIIPNFIRAKDTATDGDAKVNAGYLVKVMELCRAEVVSYVECDAEEELEEPGLELGGEPGEVAVTEASEWTFTVTAVSETATSGANHLFTISRSVSGRYTRGCTPAGEGGCPSRLDEQGNRW